MFESPWTWEGLARCLTQMVTSVLPLAPSVAWSVPSLPGTWVPERIVWLAAHPANTGTAARVTARRRLRTFGSRFIKGHLVGSSPRKCRTHATRPPHRRHARQLAVFNTTTGH